MNFAETTLKVTHRMLNKSLDMANGNVITSIRNPRVQIFFIVKLIVFDFIFNDGTELLYWIMVRTIGRKIGTLVFSACNHFIHLSQYVNRRTIHEKMKFFRF